MGLELSNRALATLLRCTHYLLRARVRDVHCTCIRGNKFLTLPGKLLGAADEAHISFTVRWPVGTFNPARRVRVRLAALNGYAEPHSLWPAIPRPTGSHETIPLDEDGWALEQITLGRTTRARVRLRMEAVRDCTAVQLQILDGRRGRVLSRPCFELIAEPQAQRLRLEELRAVGQQLWIQSGHHRHRGDLVADSSDFVMPEFIIPASELGAILPACETHVQWWLVSGHRRTLLDSEPILLGSDAAKIVAAPISLKDRILFPEMGPYCLLGSVAGRDIAAFPFRVVGRTECLQQVKVSRVQLAVRSVSRHVRLERGALHWGTHLAFRPVVRLETRIPAPNTPLRLTARLTRGHMVLRTETRSLCLRRTSQCLFLERFAIADLGPSLRIKPVRLTLSIELNGEPRIAWPIIVLPAEHLTNWEGQLNCSIRDLPVDEDAYNEILTRLVSNQEARQKLLHPDSYSPGP
jgi:hypothetical protein